jgi:purine-binding chemotaxis protein CheW
MTASLLLSAETQQLATFWLGDLLLGIDIVAIREINRVVEITPVPDAPAAVKGVVNLRGDVVTILDLRSLLGLELVELTSQSRLIVIPMEEEVVGLIVDRVTDVATVTTDDEVPLPANMGGIDGRYFTGVYKLNNDLLVVLDVAAALAVAEE